jgi:hypothetical protein
MLMKPLEKVLFLYNNDREIKNIASFRALMLEFQNEVDQVRLYYVIND